MNGSRKLTEYLNAPSHVQDAFDRRIRKQIEADLASERYIAAQESDDPIPPAPPERPAPSRTIRWDASWSKRAKSTRDPHLSGQPYNRDTDPLLALDLREVWEQLTGEDLRFNRSRCPHPKHEDRIPACKVYADGFRCWACEASGSIVDLGAVLFGIEPRGAGFFRVREELFRALGMDEERAA